MKWNEEIKVNVLFQILMQYVLAFMNQQKLLNV